MRPSRALLCALALVTACGGEAISAPVTHDSEIAAWGDSMTQGNDPVGFNYPYTLAHLLDCPVYNGGIQGESSTQIVARLLADTLHRKDALVLWAGRNNFYQPDTVVADVARGVAANRNPRGHYLVLGVTNGTQLAGEDRGGVYWAFIVALNAKLAKAHPDHFLDIRTYLVEQYDPTSPQDVYDHEHDIVPSSLRIDPQHLNPKGTDLVAGQVAAYAKAHGW